MNRYNLIKIIYNFYYKYLLKKNQKYFYLVNRFKNSIRYKNHLYFFNQGYLIKKESNKILKKLSKKIKKVIIIFYNKENLLFNYKLDKKNYQKLIERNSINFIKIKTNKKNTFKVEDDQSVLKTFYIKNNNKKRLVIIVILDGMSYDIAKTLKYTNKFFGKSYSNVWSNAEWTLPSFNNLITGNFTSSHNCYKPETLDFENNQIKNSLNIFNYFKNQDFVTGCYSGNDRFNPYYNNIEGVDIFRYCKNQRAPEVVDNMIAHIEMFKEKSNFIIGHLLDGHHLLGKVKPIELANFDSEENLYYKNFLPTEKKNKGFLKTAHRVWYEYYYNYKFNLFNYADFKLNTLYRYLNKNRFDDFSIILLGDHGSRFTENKNYQKLLNPEINKIGFFIKDKKFNGKIKKDKNISIIDIFPSMTSRFKDKKNKKFESFDGTNSLFSNFHKEIILSESLYKNKFSLLAKYKNYLYLQTFDLKEDKSISNRATFFTDSNMMEIKIKNKRITEILKKLDEYCTKHLKNDFKI